MLYGAIKLGLDMGKISPMSNAMVPKVDLDSAKDEVGQGLTQGSASTLGGGKFLNTLRNRHAKSITDLDSFNDHEKTFKGFQSPNNPQQQLNPADKPITVTGPKGPINLDPPTYSSVTPAYYKAQSYGDSLMPEAQKAIDYNQANNLPQLVGNDWFKRYPINHDSAFGVRGGGGVASGLSDNIGIGHPAPGYEKKLPLPEIVRHESYHKALEPAITDSGELQKQLTEKINGLSQPSVLRHHDVAPEEMRNYMSRLQEHQFQTTGQRFESPEQYKDFTQKIPFGAPKEQFEESIKSLPFDPQRMYRQMNEVRTVDPGQFDAILEDQAKTIPGIVNNTPDLLGAILS